MWTCFPAGDVNQPKRLTNLLRPPIRFVDDAHIETVANAAVEVLDRPGRQIQIEKVGLTAWPDQDDAPAAGAARIRHLARQLPEELGGDSVREEIAALLCTEQFWSMEIDALNDGLPLEGQGSAYRLGQPGATRVNIEFQDGRLLVHKRACWRSAGPDGRTVPTPPATFLLRTDMCLTFELQPARRAPGSAGSGRAELRATMDYCVIETSNPELREHLQQHRSSLLDTLLRMLQLVLRGRGYVVRSARREDAFRIMKTRPNVGPEGCEWHGSRAAHPESRQAPLMMLEGYRMGPVCSLLFHLKGRGLGSTLWSKRGRRIGDVLDELQADAARQRLHALRREKDDLEARYAKTGGLAARLAESLLHLKQEYRSLESERENLFQVVTWLLADKVSAKRAGRPAPPCDPITSPPTGKPGGGAPGSLAAGI